METAKKLIAGERAAQKAVRPQPFMRSALNVIFPPSCVACRVELGGNQADPTFCPSCHDAITSQGAVLCKHCGRSSPIHFSGQCGHCRKESNQFERVIALGAHRGGLRDSVVRMKHAGNHALTAAVGNLMAERAMATWMREPPDLLVSVPMHWHRRVLRGRGSSHLLAEAVQARSEIPFGPDSIVCRRKTKKQSTLTVSQRKTNVRAAFAVSSVVPVAGLHVCIVDDTMTTGATMNEISRSLKQAGADEVSVLVAARAEGLR
ncbi:MAG: ComF family protein [Planctomycetota bacterium]